LRHAKVLYLLLDVDPDGLHGSLEGLLRSLAGSWACFDLVQLRAKEAPAAAFTAALARLREVVEGEAGETPRMGRVGRGLRALRETGRPLLLANDRLDVALAGGADGVHVGALDVSPERIRSLPLPAGFVIGLTCHTRQEILDAPGRGADYAGVGTFFPSPTKPALRNDPRRALNHLPGDYALPLYAIGGITRERAAEVLSQPHVSGVVVSSAVQRAPDPAGEARAWRALVDRPDAGS
jgi:thiamine-phosphate pyrophosphorylase